MILNRSPFSKVMPFPSVFIDDKNQVNNNLIEEILLSAAIKHKMALSQFLKFLIKVTDLKSNSISIKRINRISENLFLDNYRLKWYQKSLSHNSKTDFFPFFNYSYQYIISKYKFLNAVSPDNKINFWSLTSNKKNKEEVYFLTKVGFLNILKQLPFFDIPHHLFAVYIWSFWEAHSWYDYGENKNESSFDFIADLKKLLIINSNEDILKFCLPPDKSIFDEEDKNKITDTNISNINEIFKKEIDIDQKAIALNKSNASLIFQNCPKEFTEYSNSLKNIHQLRKEILLALEGNRYRDLNILSAKLEKEEELFISNDNILKNWFENNFIESTLPPPPMNYLKNIEDADNYLLLLADKIFNNIKNSENLLKESINTFANKIRNSGLEIPKEIEKINSNFEFNLFKKIWEPIIDFELIINHCISVGIQNSGIETLVAERRLEIYKRLLDCDFDNERLSNLFIFMLDDCDPFISGKPGSISVFLLFIVKIMKMSLILPDKMWFFLNKLNSDNIVNDLCQYNIFNMLSDYKDINFKELSKIVGEHIELLPESLSYRLKLFRIKDLGPKERLKYIVKFGMAGSISVDSIKLLFETLCELQKFGEAIYLAYISNRIYRNVFSDEEIHDPLVMLMLKASKEGEYRINFIITEMLDDFEWLTHKDHDILILLYLFYRTNKNSSYMNLAYQAVDQINSAKSKYPFLVEYLIRMNDASLNVGDQKNIEKRLIYQDGKRALNDFNRELNKTSCYTNWPPAVKYQNFFRNLLKSLLLDIQNGSTMPVLDADLIIEDAYSNGLPLAQGTAISNMKRYLQNQIERLNIIFEALKNVSIIDLTFDQDDFLRRLEIEYSNINKNEAVEYVYKSMMERSQDVK